MIADAQNPKLILTPMLSKFMMEHGDKPFSPEALKRVFAELSKPGRDRSGAFSSSSAGSCLRQQEFGFIGVSQDQIIFPHLRDVFDTGTWLGAMYQARLLTANLIQDIETPYPWPKMRSKGSTDGVGYVWWETVDPEYMGLDFILELKTVGSFVYKKAVENPTPKDDHMKQIHRYMLVSGIHLTIVIYIDKGNSTGDGWHEFVVEAEPELLEESRLELKELNKAVDSKTLHPRLPPCEMGLNVAPYTTCPYGGAQGVCKKTTKGWPKK